MIYSMTAFSRVQSQGEWGNLTCEMRSINHRYLEISLHLPETLRVFEMPMRELIRKQIKRGKIECAMRYQSSPSAENLPFTASPTRWSARNASLHLVHLTIGSTN